MPAKGRPKERFCKRGHDTEKVGRVPNNGWCRTCARMAEQAGGSITGNRKFSHSVEWERLRVAKWLEIVSVDKMEPNKSTQQRRHDFDKRYEKLEADVPTPENV